MWYPMSYFMAEANITTSDSIKYNTRVTCTCISQHANTNNDIPMNSWCSRKKMKWRKQFIKFTTIGSREWNCAT